MGLGVNDPLFSWFWRLPGVVRYFLIVVIGEGPGLLLAHHHDRFDCRCYVPFRYDYAHHMIFLLAIPVYITLLPILFRTMENTLAGLSEVPDGEFNLDRRYLKRLRRLWKDPKMSVATALPGIAVTMVVGILNIRGHIDSGRTVYVWWFNGSLTGPIIIYGIFAIVAAICTPPLFQYVGVINVIRKSVPNHERISPWVGASPGPLYNLFAMFMATLSPLLLIPSMIFWTRVSKGIAVTEPLTFVSLILVPIGVVALALLPCYISGVPGRLRRQRDRLLQNNSLVTANLMRDLASAHKHYNSEELKRHMSLLSEKRIFILKNHPVWPVPTFKAALGTIVAILTIASTILAVIGNFSH
jgi:hypothetical protein